MAKKVNLRREYENACRLRDGLRSTIERINTAQIIAAHARQMAGTLPLLWDSHEKLADACRELKVLAEQTA